MARFTLDIGVVAVDDHTGHIARVNDDDSLTEIASEDVTETTGTLRAVCSCGWTSDTDWDTTAAADGGSPDHYLVHKIEGAWIRHIYDDVVPADRRSPSAISTAT